MGDGLLDVRGRSFELDTGVTLSNVTAFRGGTHESVFGQRKLEIEFGAPLECFVRAQEAAAFGERQDGADGSPVRAPGSEPKVSCECAGSFVACLRELLGSSNRRQKVGPVESPPQRFGGLSRDGRFGEATNRIRASGASSMLGASLSRISSTSQIPLVLDSEPRSSLRVYPSAWSAS